MPTPKVIITKYSEDNVQCLLLGNSGYEYFFMVEKATIKFLYVKESSTGLFAELTIDYPVNTPLLSHIKINLYLNDKRKKLAEDLAKKYSEVLVQWDEMLEYTITDVIKRWREPPEIVNIDTEPENISITYLLSPILPMNQPTTIFAQGGVGKSLLADYIAVLLTHGVSSPIGLLPEQGAVNVLYLDWESDNETHKRFIKAIENGLELTEHKQIYYLSCTKPLNDYAEHIKELIQTYDIKLVIIDSQMAATADSPHGMTEAQVAGEYYNIIRSWNITTLTIDHVTKQDMNSGNGSAPYGSVVKYNRSRSQYELKMDETYEDSEHKEYALVHKKHNLTRKQQPLGLSVDFVNEGNSLLSIDVNRCNIASNMNLSQKTLSKTQRIINYLKQVGTSSIKDIAEQIGETDNRAVGVLLANKKKVFIKLGDGIYGLLENQQELQ